MRKTAREMNEIMWAAPLVMGARLSRMMLPDAMRTASDRAEDVRMIAEKTAATFDGVVAMQSEMANQMMNAWWGMAFGKAPNLKKAADKVAAAGLKPVRARVKSNVKRLSKRKVSK